MKLSSEIVTLARRISEREDVIDQMRQRNLAGVNETICEALLQGQDLLELKARTKHGDWANHLRAYCPKLNIRRAQRYMLLAQHAPDKELGEVDSLRAALALCSAEEGQHSEPKRWPAYITAIGRVSKLRDFVHRNPITAWPSEGLSRFKEEFEPIARQLWPELFTSSK